MNSSLVLRRTDPALKKAWGDWIDEYQWSCFITMTFDMPRDPINTLKGGRWAHKTSGSVRSAIFVEPFQKIEGYHLHGLLYVPEKINSLEPFMKSLQKRMINNFGLSKVLPAWAGHASRYVTKHTGDLDTQGLEWELLGDWEIPNIGINN